MDPLEMPFFVSTDWPAPPYQFIASFFQIVNQVVPVILVYTSDFKELLWIFVTILKELLWDSCITNAANMTSLLQSHRASAAHDDAA